MARIWKAVKRKAHQVGWFLKAEGSPEGRILMDRAIKTQQQAVDEARYALQLKQVAYMTKRTAAERNRFERLSNKAITHSDKLDKKADALLKKADKKWFFG